MRIEIRNDSVLLDGYVNAVLRDSRLLRGPQGPFVEQIMPHAFERALERAKNVDLMLNHERKIGSTAEGNLELFEDAIGLRAICTVTDPEVIQKAREEKLRGWSFGFIERRASMEDAENGIKRRYVEDLDLKEVTIVDDRKIPCYTATSIETRAGDEAIQETRFEAFRAVTVDERTPLDESESAPPDYSLYEKRIQLLNLGGTNE